jgi:hypothetical protein
LCQEGIVSQARDSTICCLHGTNYGANPAPMEWTRMILRSVPLWGVGNRTLNTLPNCDDIAAVGAEADFGLIVWYLLHVKPLEGWGSIECWGMDRVVVNEEHVRQPA